MKLFRYWITFDQLEPYDSLQMGCGITAYTEEDAINILCKTILFGKKIPKILSIVENIDINSLDEGHVIPNMESPVWRGVWFPKGFAEVR